MSSRFEVPKPLTEEERNRVKVNGILQGILDSATESSAGRSVTPGQAKNYFEFCELLNQAIKDYQGREKAPYNRMVDLSWERPNLPEETERITISLKERLPGAFDGGPPMEGKVRNWRPILRQKCQSEKNPGYLTAVLGKLYDNKIGLTVWAQTNKEAIERAFWLEELIDKYTWFFRASGVGRVLFYSQEEDEFIDNDGQKIYGRQLCYFVRTEKITTIDEKTIEDIFLNLSVGRTVPEST